MTDRSIIKTLKQKDKRTTVLYSHLSIRDTTPTSCPLNEIKHFYGHALAQEPLLTESINLQIWQNLPWSSLHYCLINAQEQRKIFLKKYCIITIYILNGHILAQEIYNFGRPFLGQHYYIISLSNRCPGQRADF